MTRSDIRPLTQRRVRPCQNARSKRTMSSPERGACMRRREFLCVLGSATGWPLGVHAQQSGLPVVGFLNGGSSDGYAPMLGAFRQGLKEAGYVESQNVAIEYRWGNGQYDR